MIFRDHHATLFLDAEVSAAIDTLRMQWDPAMAHQIAPHLTLLYPSECPDLDLMVRRASTLAARSEPFEVRLGGYAAFPPPWQDGIYVEVAAPAWVALRQTATAPPCSPVDTHAHITIIHPRTAQPGAAAEFWAQSVASLNGLVARIVAIDLTAFDGSKWTSTLHLPFAGDD